MTFNLLMKRKVFATLQVLCSEYEEKFKEKVATASVVNVLLAEALINRGLIPQDFIKIEYGCPNPICLGFTARARNEKILLPLEVQQQQTELNKWSRTFSIVLDQWADHNDPKWREHWIAKAKEWKDRVPNAKLVLALSNGQESS